MNYYIQGDAAKAEQIKAAFETKGFVPRIAPMYYGSESVLFFTGEENYIYETSSPWVMNIIKTHPNYEELEPLHNFKKGDLLVHNSSDTRIISVVDVSEKYGYQVQDGGSRHHLSFNVVENEYHLWSIQDAKDGDVLATDNGWTCIFQVFDGYVFSSYCFMDSQKWFCEVGSEAHTQDSRINGKIHPATKEQRDLLFAKMREAGYEWDADKKELRKIQPHYDISNFQAGMPVLVRDNNKEWRYVPFSHITNGSSWVFNALGTIWEQCIPFNEDTKHLLGTTDMCDERYINW